MIDEIALWVKRAARGEITEAAFDGFNLSLGGKNWGFGTTSPWRVIENGNLVVGCADIDGAKIALESIVGNVLVDVRPQSSGMAGDPALVVSSGQIIEVFSDTPVDPWTFVTPEMTYVGTPGDERYNR